ncbi:MAG: iron-sulfur cluster assembly scaffold protein [Promethearchaeota archaeon]|jgi:NifU-like protein involved in Fe-S cluster formation
MPENFEEFVEKLQREIIEKEIEDHNEKIVSLCHNPQNWGKPPKDKISVYEERRGGSKGYFLGLYLRIKNDKIVKANFITDGCGVMIATGSQITLMLEGKSIEYAYNLTVMDIDKALMGLPKDEKDCADLAIDTLKSIIEKYKSR